MDAPHELPEAQRELELDGAAFRALVERVLPRLEHYLDTLSEQPAWSEGLPQPTPGLRGGLPEDGRAVDEVLEEIFALLEPEGFHTAGPGYLAYVPGGGLPESAVAELIANLVNRYVGVAVAAPGWARLEARVVRWLCSLCGFGEGAGGYLATGDSMANLSGLVGARQAKLGEELGGGVLYASDQAHYSVAKSARLAGFPARAVRALPTDERQAIRVEGVAERIERDRAEGLRPFLLVASAGTTNTGAVDPLEELAELCAEHGLWLHVDAAYGGAFLLTERGRAALAGIERADSVTLDPHKGLFLPYGTGALLCRRREHLVDAHSATAAYMPAWSDDEEAPDFATLSPELSREFRGLRLWLPLCLHGAGAFRRALDEKLDLARWAAGELERLPHVRLLDRPTLSLFAFYLEPPGLDLEQQNELNRAWLARANAPRRFYLTPTTIEGRFVLRICVLSFRTHADRMRECVDTLRETAAELLAS